MAMEVADFEVMRLAMARVASSSPSKGTTLLTNPKSSAVYRNTRAAKGNRIAVDLGREGDNKMFCNTAMEHLFVDDC